MYDYGRRVYVKALDRIGYVSERNRLNGKAVYVVQLYDSGATGAKRDYMTGSDGLRPADGFCDACNRWLSASSFNGGASNEEIAICFQCSRNPRWQEKWKKDKYGRKWPAYYELCPECGQPDNCGDCNHERLSDQECYVLIDRLAWS
jgi:hypothetical protein